MLTETEFDLDDFLAVLVDTRANIQYQISRSQEARRELKKSCAVLATTMSSIRRTGAASLELFSIGVRENIQQRSPLDTLSPRERQVMKLIAEGLSTKQIADALGISFKTAVTHRTNLLKKLNVHESTSLVRLAIRAGMVAA